MNREVHRPVLGERGAEMPRATQLLARLYDGDGSTSRHRMLLPVLQSGTSSSKPWVSDSGGDLPGASLVSR